MKKRPRVLVTNDDGIYAPGIRHLFDALNQTMDVYVVAPLMEQSAASLSITIRAPLRLEPVSWGNQANLPACRVWGVGGTPADCIKLALGMILDEAPDLVVSGINRGSNAGRNLLYSGTVAGAIEGVMHDIPSIAFSCIDSDDPDYATVTEYVPKIAQYVLDHPLADGTLLNVNFPSKTHAKINGFKLTRQGREFWLESPCKHEHPLEAHAYYWLGAKLMEYPEEHDSDIAWLRQGYIAAVPVYVKELTNHRHLESHKLHFEETMMEYHLCL